MPAPEVLVTFAIATLVLLVIPGPAVMYIVTRSATQGRVAGLVSVAGIHVGTLFHIVAAMLGLSALLVASATAFMVVKAAGAAYLIFLGIQAFQAWRRGGKNDGIEVVPARSLSKVFRDGVVVNVLNPKTAVFFLSFVPQFVDPSEQNPTVTLAVLGALFVLLGIISDSAYAVAGGWIGLRLAGSPKIRRGKDLFAAGTYVGLGLFTIFSGNRS